ncbi:hypothetical protein NGB36_31610 [Streptomyces sp. RB6PN25]|uniref:Uncharacterized protein n=1 Tax=Streptomyces humicola TaxID=2953240 RepID=A0ABT1Q4Y7_9ACTN|nr:hypothetical protein [Streptomyces humicola]MCQ4084987.1 hypothetical protein [Streptomyces humicola]
MRIEMTWPRAGAADRTLTLSVPDVPVAGLVRPAARQVRRLSGLCGPGALRGVAACIEPIVGGVASSTGAGVLVQLALPFAVRLVRQSRGAAPSGEDLEPSSRR